MPNRFPRSTPWSLVGLALVLVGPGLVLAGCQPWSGSRSLADVAEPTTAAVSSTVTEPEPVPRRVVADDPSLATTRIVISNRELQEFAGFGAGLHPGAVSKVPLEMHRELARLTWGADGLRIARLWYPVGDATGDAFRATYLDSGLVREALAAGCTTLLLAPCQIPKAMRLSGKTPVQPDAAGEGAKPAKEGKSDLQMISDDDVVLLMGRIAALIERVRREDGVTIHVTGIMNEPNAVDRLTVAQTPLAVRTLRRELDARGLADVQIVAPEAASADWAYDQRVQALHGDAAAWAALSGLAWHSYNMALMPKQGAFGRQFGKAMWMTEASANGREQANDRAAAASLAARAASDLRNGATHWMWFISYCIQDPKDDQTRLIRIFNAEDPPRYELLGKFHVIRELCATFPPGSRIVEVASDPAQRPWTYGRKPPVQAVAARRPDGGIALLASNFTADSFPAASDKGTFEKDNAGLPARSFRLLYTLPFKKGTAFVRRRFERLDEPIDEVIRVADGQLALVLRPLETLTVRVVR